MVFMFLEMFGCSFFRLVEVSQQSAAQPGGRARDFCFRAREERADTCW